MTNTSHKDTSTNSYTSTDDLIPEYSFEDLPSEKDREYGIDYILGALLAFLGIIIMFFIQLFVFLSPFILVGLGIHYFILN